MYRYMFLLCITIRHYSSGENEFSSLIDNVLLHKNINYVTYLYDKNVNISSFICKGCSRVNFQKINKNVSNNRSYLSQHAFVVIFNDIVQEEILQHLPLAESPLIVAISDFNKSSVDTWTLTNLEWNSDITIICEKKNASNISYEFWEMYGLNNQSGILTQIGTWSNFIQEKRKNSFYRNRKNVHGSRLEISSRMCNNTAGRTLQEEYAFLKVEREINCILFNLVQYIHNFSIGIAESKRLDVTSGFMEESLINVADVIAETYPFRKAFILKNPVGGDKNIFIRPFSSKVWYMFILLIFITIVLLKILLSVLYAFEMIDDKSWSLVILILLSTICLEGSPIQSNFLSFRAFVYTCLLASMMLYNYYSSSIVSLLLTEPAPSIKSLGDLRKTNIKLRVENIPNYYKPENKLFTTNDLNTILNLNEAIVAIKKGDFAYYTEPATRYKLLQKHLTFLETCSLIEIDSVPVAFVTVMARKKMAFKELLKITYRILIERGFLNREIRRLLQRKPVCLAHVDLTILTLQDLAAAFILYIMGVILSAIVFLLEHLHFRIVNLYRKKMQ